MSTAIIDVPIGSNCTFGFVFRDTNDTPLDLADTEFVFSARYPGGSLAFDTTTDAAILFVEESANIEPVGQPAYVADRLVLALTPDISREIPPGALTTWEIERRKDGEERNWGTGMFRGFGGVNPDA